MGLRDAQKISVHLYYPCGQVVILMTSPAAPMEPTYHFVSTPPAAVIVVEVAVCVVPTK
jgi:hypothetical protein